MATLLDNFAPSPELEAVLLQAWLLGPPGRELLDRLMLIRALNRLYYAGVLFSASAADSRAAPDTDISAPTLRDFQRSLRDGRLRPDALETRHVLGKMFLASFLSGAAAPGLPPPFSQFQLERLRLAPEWTAASPNPAEI
jgi:hypothetical protein